MSRQFRQVALCVICLVGTSSLLVWGVMRRPPLAVGQARVTYQITSPWRIGAWSERHVEWDEMPGQPPGQVYQVRTQQFGPFIVENTRRVAPRPGEVSP